MYVPVVVVVFGSARAVSERGRETVPFACGNSVGRPHARFSVRKRRPNSAHKGRVISVRMRRPIPVRRRYVSPDYRCVSGMRHPISVRKRYAELHVRLCVYSALELNTARLICFAQHVNSVGFIGGYSSRLVPHPSVAPVFYLLGFPSPRSVACFFFGGGRSTGWIVLFVPDARNLVQKGIYCQPSPVFEKLYDLPVQASVALHCRYSTAVADEAVAATVVIDAAVVRYVSCGALWIVVRHVTALRAVANALKDQRRPTPPHPSVPHQKSKQCIGGCRSYASAPHKRVLVGCSCSPFM